MVPRWCTGWPVDASGAQFPPGVEHTRLLGRRPTPHHKGPTGGTRRGPLWLPPRSLASGHWPTVTSPPVSRPAGVESAQMPSSRQRQFPRHKGPAGGRPETMAERLGFVTATRPLPSIVTITNRAPRSARLRHIPNGLRTRGGPRSRDLDVRTVALCPAELLGLTPAGWGRTYVNEPEVGADPTTSALPRRRSAN